MTAHASQIDQGGGPPGLLNWAVLLAEHEAWLRGVILARTGESQAVDEVWQDVSLAAVQQQAPVEDPARAPGWLYRLAVIRSIRHRRQAIRHRQRCARLAEEGSGAARQVEDPFGWLLREERRQLVRDAVTRLPGKDAEILVLKYQHHWSYARIATVLGISESAVDGRVFRARERLRSLLAEHFTDEETTS